VFQVRCRVKSSLSPFANKAGARCGSSGVLTRRSRLAQPSSRPSPRCGQKAWHSPDGADQSNSEEREITEGRRATVRMCGRVIREDACWRRGAYECRVRWTELRGWASAGYGHSGVGDESPSLALAGVAASIRLRSWAGANFPHLPGLPFRKLNKRRQLLPTQSPPPIPCCSAAYKQLRGLAAITMAISMSATGYDYLACAHLLLYVPGNTPCTGLRPQPSSQ
jgi:hypothetical protein